MKHFTNKKGGVIGYTFFLIAFILVWAVWLGSYLNELGATYITQNSPNSIETIFYGYLNLWLAIGLIVGTFAYYYYAIGG